MANQSNYSHAHPSSLQFQALYRWCPSRGDPSRCTCVHHHLQNPRQNSSPFCNLPQKLAEKENCNLQRSQTTPEQTICGQTCARTTVTALHLLVARETVVCLGLSLLIASLQLSSFFFTRCVRSFFSFFSFLFPCIFLLYALLVSSLSIFFYPGFSLFHFITVDPPCSS